MRLLISCYSFKYSHPLIKLITYFNCNQGKGPNIYDDSMNNID